MSHSVTTTPPPNAVVTSPSETGAEEADIVLASDTVATTSEEVAEDGPPVEETGTALERVLTPIGDSLSALGFESEVDQLRAAEAELPPEEVLFKMADVVETVLAQATVWVEEVRPPVTPEAFAAAVPEPTAHPDANPQEASPLPPNKARELPPQVLKCLQQAVVDGRQLARAFGQKTPELAAKWDQLQRMLGEQCKSAFAKFQSASKPAIPEHFTSAEHFLAKHTPRQQALPKPVAAAPTINSATPETTPNASPKSTKSSPQEALFARTIREAKEFVGERQALRQAAAHQVQVMMGAVAASLEARRRDAQRAKEDPVSVRLAAMALGAEIFTGADSREANSLSAGRFVAWLERGEWNPLMQVVSRAGSNDDWENYLEERRPQGRREASAAKAATAAAPAVSPPKPHEQTLGDIVQTRQAATTEPEKNYLSLESQLGTKQDTPYYRERLKEALEAEAGVMVGQLPDAEGDRLGTVPA